MLQNVTEHYGALQDVMEALWKHYEMLWSIMEHFGVLWDVTECYGSIVDRYVTLWEHYGAVRENVDFAHMAQNANDVFYT